MSIYSGFATRQQESFYDKLVFKLIELIQDKIVFQYLPNDSEIFDEKIFARKVVKIFRTLKKLEQNKHLEPNYSDAFKQLSEVLLNNYKDSSSIASSSIYGGQSQKSGYINNNLAEKVKRDTSLSSDEGLTVQSLRNHEKNLQKYNNKL